AITITGLEEEESLALLRYLYEHATKLENVYSHRWQLGDLAIWDNPSMMHLASYPQDDQPRVLYRIVTQGELPVI
ncbi:MAG: TauD/TfdA family dioxygenase, partial [Gammaproteobacteria bacterium]|nr:TauD/TfdA family dioxygenase [Gammaproteobacteria bacterium]